ncbi:MAG TPA: PfkB family carbohydrate kinase [Conexibacter sp.]
MPDLDLLTIGRVNFDLYAQQAGVEFADVTSWDAMVGGSPANVALAAARLGARTAILTAVGADPVGDWVLRALAREGVETAGVARKQGPHTSLALRAQRPPDHPLAFYRHDPADVHVTVEDAAALPLEHVRTVLASADAFARGTMPEACAAVLRRARELGKTVYMDLDLREVSWPDHAAYGAAVAAAVEYADVLVGTEEEYAALLGMSAAAGERAVAAAVETRISREAGRVVILKHGERGATVLAGDEPLHVPAYPVAEASTVGAGDSFAAGLVCARLRGSGWADAARFASACAAITVSRLGCSSGFPTLDEVVTFAERDVLTGGRA